MGSEMCIRDSDCTTAHHAVISDIIHDHSVVADPAILTDRNFLKNPALILDRYIERFNTVLTLATQQMNAATEQAIRTDTDTANIAIGADIHTWGDGGITLRKQTTERDGAIRAAIAHGQPIEGDAHKTTYFSRQQTQTLREAREQPVAISHQ